MPESPRWRRKSAICRRGWSFGAKASCRFGRSKECTTRCGGCGKSCWAMSLARLPVGGRGQRRHRHAAERLARLGEQAVFGPEIVAPLRDAMRLVDGEPADAERRRRRPTSPSPASRSGETKSRRNSPEFSRSQASAASLSLFIELSEAAGDAGAGELADLVAHQGDQRRDDECQPAARPEPGAGSTSTCRSRSASPRRRRARRARPRSPPIARGGNRHSRRRFSASRALVIRWHAAWLPCA